MRGKITRFALKNTWGFRPSKNKTSIFGLLFYLLFVVSWAGFSAKPDASDEKQITVLQWNIYYGKGTDEVYDRERQVAWMVRFAPDVISLNEVLPDEAVFYHQLLASTTGVTWYSYHVPAQADGTGNQILSKYPFVSTDSYTMTTNGIYSRAVAQATIDVGGVLVHLFSTHLDHNNEAIRLAQVLELRSYLNRFLPPYIIAGDLNAAPDSKEVGKLMKKLRDSWQIALDNGTASAYPDNPPAWGTRTHKERIDYILYSKKPKYVTAAEALIMDTRDLNNASVIKRLGTPDDKGVRPSDHNPVAVKFRIQIPPGLATSSGYGDSAP